MNKIYEEYTVEQRKAEHFISNESLKNSTTVVFHELTKVERFNAKEFGFAILDLCERLSESANYKKYTGQVREKTSLYEEFQGQDIGSLNKYDLLRNWLENGRSNYEMHQEALMVIKPFENFLAHIESYKDVQKHLEPGSSTTEVFYLPAQTYMSENGRDTPFAVTIELSKDMENNYLANIDFMVEKGTIDDDKAYRMMIFMRITDDQRINIYKR